MTEGKYIAVAAILLFLLIGIPSALVFLLEPLSKKAFAQFARELTASQIATVKIDFKRVRLKNWSGIEWEDFGVYLLFGRGDQLLSEKMLMVRSPKFILEYKRNSRRLFNLKFEGAEFTVSRPGARDILQRAQVRRVQVETALDLRRPSVLRKQVKFLAEQMKSFLFLGSSKLAVDLSAVSRFEISNKIMTAELQVKEEEGSYRLVMSEADLRRISLELAEKLTAGEVRFISKHPLQAPKMLDIRDQASLAARAMAQADPKFPEDAYRHIYWSYLLTQEFSEKLAEEITTAHELGSSNSEEDSQMDLNNNRLGRQYAKEGVSSDSLIQKVFDDPAVIRSVKPEPPPTP